MAPISTFLLIKFVVVIKKLLYCYSKAIKIMKNYNKLKELVQGAEADFEKFYEKGNAAAGTRVRKAMQEMKGLAQDIRQEVTAKKNK